MKNGDLMIIVILRGDNCDATFVVVNVLSQEKRGIGEAGKVPRPGVCPGRGLGCDCWQLELHVDHRRPNSIPCWHQHVTSHYSGTIHAYHAGRSSTWDSAAVIADLH